MIMLQLFLEGGIYMLPLLALAVVILVLTVKKALDLFLREGLGREQLERGLGAILFWGCVAAVLGLLGQLQGQYLSLRIISQAEIISPNLVAEGMAVSLITTLFGLLQLAFAGIAWFTLSTRFRRLTARLEGGRTAIA
jgi:biopolymer transport protein ExbB/TolQ